MVIFWLFLFFLGFVLINYPFISIFDKKIFVFGYPLLYIYFFVGWLVSIIVVYIFSRKIDDE
jgi:Na+-driven multidrug efflux pump